MGNIGKGELLILARIEEVHLIVVLAGVATGAIAETLQILRLGLMQ